MKKKCLIIIPGVPYPPVDGHKLKIYNLIKILHRFYDLHIITISRSSLTSESLGFISQHSYKCAHFKITLRGALIRLFKAIFSDVPFQVSFFDLKSVRNYIRNETCDDKLVFANLIRTVAYFDLFRTKCKVLDMVDLLSKSYNKSSETTSSAFYKFIYKVEAKRLLHYEQRAVREFDYTLFVNEEESFAMKQFGNVSWLPNGVNDALFHYSKKSSEYQDGIAFFGTMFYQPNIDAVLWFEKHVLKLLDSGIRLYVIGARPSLAIRQLAKKYSNVVVTGFLEDPYLILNSCFAIIAPMQNGGGIQNKILETMGMGKINVLSSHGARPIIGAEDNRHFYVADDGRSIAGVINDIFRNPSKHRAIGENAKEIIKKNYTWTSYEDRLMSILAKFKIDE